MNAELLINVFNKNRVLIPSKVEKVEAPDFQSLRDYISSKEVEWADGNSLQSVIISISGRWLGTYLHKWDFNNYPATFVKKWVLNGSYAD